MLYAIQNFKIYFSFIFKNKKSNQITATCLQYWIKIWYNINKSIKPVQNQKHLIEQLLKIIIKNTEDAVLQDLSNKCENFEIILLKSGQENYKLKQYFETNLVNYLNKLQERKIKRLAYKELVSKMVSKTSQSLSTFTKTSNVLLKP